MGEKKIPCGIYALSVLLPTVDTNTLEQDFIPQSINGRASMTGLQNVAKKHNLKLHRVMINYMDLKNIGEPVIVKLNLGFSPESGAEPKENSHFVVLKKVDNTNVTYMDNGEEKIVSRREFENQWDERKILTTRTDVGHVLRY